MCYCGSAPLHLRLHIPQGSEAPIVGNFRFGGRTRCSATDSEGISVSVIVHHRATLGIQREPKEKERMDEGLGLRTEVAWWVSGV
jgi:hypothetical protein